MRPLSAQTCPQTHTERRVGYASSGTWKEGGRRVSMLLWAVACRRVDGGGRRMLGELEVTEPFLSDVPILESKKR